MVGRKAVRKEPVRYSSEVVVIQDRVYDIIRYADVLRDHEHRAEAKTGDVWVLVRKHD